MRQRGEMMRQFIFPLVTLCIVKNIKNIKTRDSIPKNRCTKPDAMYPILYRALLFNKGMRESKDNMTPKKMERILRLHFSGTGSRERDV